jgi:hypothetical protein
LLLLKKLAKDIIDAIALQNGKLVVARVAVYKLSV